MTKHIPIPCIENEVELERLDRVNKYQIDMDEPRKPDTYSVHEILDRVSILVDMVDDYVMDHPSCFNDSELYKSANEAQTKLCLLYQKIASKIIIVND